jgi:hypothetical protein
MISFLILLLLQGTATPKSTISGIVIDGGAPYTQPLIDARVQLEGSPIVIRTDMDGRFSFPGSLPDDIG